MFYNKVLYFILLITCELLTRAAQNVSELVMGSALLLRGLIGVWCVCVSDTGDRTNLIFLFCPLLQGFNVSVQTACNTFSCVSADMEQVMNLVCF